MPRSVRRSRRCSSTPARTATSGRSTSGRCRVREFGTIYEGLLESSLSVARRDLTVDRKTRRTCPATRATRSWSPRGTVYFHNASGERKATGSYFTKSFVVEHLLEAPSNPRSPTTSTTVAGLLDAGDEAGGRRAVLRLPRRRPRDGLGPLPRRRDRQDRSAGCATSSPSTRIPRVTDELARLAQAAHDALGDLTRRRRDRADASLLRRQIARRCIYGLDINPMAVELARLAHLDSHVRARPADVEPRPRPRHRQQPHRHRHHRRGAGRVRAEGGEHGPGRLFATDRGDPGSPPATLLLRRRHARRRQPRRRSRKRRGLTRSAKEAADAAQVDSSMRLSPSGSAWSQPVPVPDERLRSTSVSSERKG